MAAVGNQSPTRISNKQEVGADGARAFAYPHKLNGVEGTSVTASAGSYSLDLDAADPGDSPTYEKKPPSELPCPAPSGGTGTNDGSALPNADYPGVNSLSPDQMILGQVVPFELKVSVSGSTLPENGRIKAEFDFNTKTSSNRDFGYDPAFGLYCAFVDTGDASKANLDGNEKVESFSHTILNPGMNNEAIRGTVVISGLDDGASATRDTVIVEIWVVLKSTIPSDASGNVQASVASAMTCTSPFPACTAGNTISVGNQTIPLLRVGEFLTNDADVSITKADSPDPVQRGGTLSYTLTVSNAGPNSANGITVTDTLPAETTFVSATTPGGSCSESSGTVTCNTPGLSVGGSTSVTITVTVNNTAPTAGTVQTGTCAQNPNRTSATAGVDLCNLASVATSVSDDTNSSNNSDSEPTNVQQPAVNNPPVANSGSATTNEDTATTVTLTGSDPDGCGGTQVFTFTVVSQPVNGAVSPTSGSASCSTGSLSASVTYTPAANFCGSDPFTFKFNDGSADSNTATFTMTVTCVNDAPVAEDGSDTTAEDTSKLVTLEGSDPDGCGGTQVFTFTIVSQPANGSVAPASGSATCSGSGSLSASVTYTPDPNFCGEDSFTFKFSDGTEDSNVATFTMTVTCVNDAPVADNGSDTTNEDTPAAVTLDGSDPDGCGGGQTFTFQIVTQPANGSVAPTSGSAMCAAGALSAEVVYTPNLNFCGEDSFTFKFNDGTEDSNTATFTMTVTCVNDPPVATPGADTTDEDTSKQVTLTGLDVDGCDGGQVFTFTIVTQPPSGTVAPTSGSAACLGSGSLSASVSYTPDPNFCGEDSFTFKFNDGSADSNTATFAMTVTCVNDPPVADNGSDTTNEDTPKTVTLEGSDVDGCGGGQVFTFEIVTQPANGTVAPATGGAICDAGSLSAEVVYTPNANFCGTDSFEFKFNDGSADSNIATFTITVTCVNDPPVANPGGDTTDEDTSKQVTLTGLDVDGCDGGQIFTFEIVTQPANGAVSPSSGSATCTAGALSATVTYTPDPDFCGADSFEFKFNDGSADSNTATFAMVVTCIPDLPGKVTGGGEIRVPPGSNGKDFASFGFVVNRKVTDAVPTGQLEYYNHARRLNVHSTALLTLNIVDDTAIFTGTCVKGTGGGPKTDPCTFTVTVRDIGEPGRNVDHFTIAVSGEPVEGSLTTVPPTPIIRGNIQIHKSGTQVATLSSGAGAGTFSSGAELNGVALSALDFGHGLATHGDGSASGDFQAVLAGTSVLGQPQSIALESKVNSGSRDADGSVTFTGLASVDMGNGQILEATPFRVTVTQGGLQLVIGTTALPLAAVSDGGITITEG